MALLGLDGADDGTAIFINRFTVHGSPEEFERAFADIGGFMSERDGFLWHVLLSPVGDEEGEHYVNIALWKCEADLRAAVAEPGFATHVESLRALATSEPSLYRPRKIGVGSSVFRRNERT